MKTYFQTLRSTLHGSDVRAYVPGAIRRLTLWARHGSRIWQRSSGVTGHAAARDGLGHDGAEFEPKKGPAGHTEISARPDHAITADPEHGFCYEYGWMLRDLEPASDPSMGRWLVFLDRRGIGERVARELSARCAGVVRVRRGKCFAALPDGTFQIRPGERAELRHLLCSANAGDFEGVLCFWGADAYPAVDPESIESAAGGLSLIQALREVRAERPVPVFLITMGAQPVPHGRAGTGAEPGRTPLAPMLRVPADAYSSQTFRSVDLDPHHDCLLPLLRELDADDGEAEIAYRAGLRYARRLYRRPGSYPSSGPGEEDHQPARPDGFGLAHLPKSVVLADDSIAMRTRLDDLSEEEIDEIIATLAKL